MVIVRERKKEAPDAFEELAEVLSYCYPERLFSRAQLEEAAALCPDTHRLTEVLQKAGAAHLKAFKKQMAQDKELCRAMTTPIKDLPKYKYLTDDPILENATLIDIIEVGMKKPALESYFIQNSKGLYVGFIVISIAGEAGKKFVDNVKLFSFGLPKKEDENMIFKDAPKLLDDCLRKFYKVTWKALKGNRANAAYEIYRKKKGGERKNAGNAWVYTCYGKGA